MKKEWKAKFDWNEIKVVNEWNLDCSSIEEVFINDKLIERRDKSIKKTSFDKSIISSKFEFDYKWNKIKILCWSSWYFWTACKILVNWEFIWWNRIVLFCK